MAQWYNPVYNDIFCEFLTLLLLIFDSLPEISPRTVLHYQTKGIAVSEVGFVSKNMGVVKTMECCRFLPVVLAEIGYSHLLQCVLKQHKKAVLWQGNRAMPL